MTWEGLTPPYSVIVIDPPWPLEYSIHRRVRPNDKSKLGYSTMSLDEIAGLPVADLAADVATVFLWSIDRFLYDSRALLEGWGFKYHLTMAWDKGNGPALYGFTRRTEFVLVGFAGAHETYPSRPTIRSGFYAASPGHSVKPPSFFDMLETLEGPKVELFARQPRLGWDSWGLGYELADQVGEPSGTLRSGDCPADYWQPGLGPCICRGSKHLAADQVGKPR